ncbi:MAG: hypothetical protein ACT4P9_18330 [Betaproteobacteria bacterium]
MRHVLSLLAAALLSIAPFAHAQEVSLGAADTVQSVLQAQKGKRVTVRLAGGQELTGVVREATGKLVALGALTGREFFDAVIPLEKIEAVLIRTR